jgi:hypothetical protein
MSNVSVRDELGRLDEVVRRRSQTGVGKEDSITFRASAEFAAMLHAGAESGGLFATDYLVAWLMLTRVFCGVPRGLALTLAGERERLQLADLDYVYFCSAMRARRLRRSRRGSEACVFPPPAVPGRGRAPKGEAAPASVTFRCWEEAGRDLRAWARAYGTSTSTYIKEAVRRGSAFQGLDADDAEALAGERERLKLSDLEYAHYCYMTRAIDVRMHGEGFDLTDAERSWVARRAAHPAG